MHLKSLNFTFKTNIFSTGIVLFLSSFSLLLLFSNPDFTYEKYEGTVSAASTNLYSISKRVSLYYKGISLFVILSLLLFYLLSKIPTSIKENACYKWLGSLGFTATFLIFFAALGLPIDQSLNFVLSLGILPLLNCFAILFYKKSKAFSSLQFSLIYSLGLILTFTIMQIQSYCLISKSNDVFTVWNCCSFISLLIFKFIPSIENNLFRFQKLIYIPLLYTACIELFLIFNQRGWNQISYQTVIIMVYLVLAIFIVLDWRKNVKDPIKRSLDPNHFLINRLFPCLLLALIWNGYQMIQLDQYPEMFEYANPANGIMRLFKHGEIPFVDFYGSHLLYDLYQGILYTLFNGLDSKTSFSSYYFLDHLIFGIITYFFLLKLFKNAYFSILIILVFPLIQFIFNGSYVLNLLLVFAIYRMYIEPENSKRNWQLIAFGLLVSLWKMDFLVAGGGAAFLTVLLIFGPIIILKKLMIPLITIAGCFLVLIVGLAFWKNVPLLDHLTQLYHYFSGAQNHGLLDVALQHDRFFFVHFILFPLLICLFAVYHCKQIKRDDILKREPFGAIALLFLICFYLLNAQRGLVRHSFLEGSDNYISAYLYAIIGLGFYLYAFKVKESASRLIAFCCVLTFSYFMFSYQGISLNNNRELIFETFHKVKTIKNSDTKIVRVIPNIGFENVEINPFKHFMNRHFSKNETFIDFSNTPMLYYYTGRKIPALFSQTLQNAHDELLQCKQILGYKNFKTPVLLFRRNGQLDVADGTDGVPNTLRYFLITSYLYDHYSPFTILGNHCVWLRNGTKLVANNYPLDTISLRAQNIHLGGLANLWTARFKKLVNRSMKKDAIQTTDSTFNIKVSGNVSIIAFDLKTKIKKQGIDALLYDEKNVLIGSFQFWGKPGLNSYTLPHFIHYKTKKANFTVSLKKKNIKNIRSSSFTFNLEQVLNEYK